MHAMPLEARILSVLARVAVIHTDTLEAGDSHGLENFTLVTIKLGRHNKLPTFLIALLR